MPLTNQAFALMSTIEAAVDAGSGDPSEGSSLDSRIACLGCISQSQSLSGGILGQRYKGLTLKADSSFSGS